MKRHLLSLLFICTVLLSYGQKVIELSSPMQTGGVNHSCGGYLLKPGFSFKSSLNNTLSFGIDKLSCLNWVDNIIGYDSNGYPIGYEIDKQRDVGGIPFESTITPVGTVASSIPIELYPGRDGFQPNMSLIYNSISGNGIAGIGWAIGGLSQISKTHKSIYYDNVVASIGDNSPIQLDGIRILTINQECISEKGNIKILSDNAQYTALYPNGTKAIFSKNNTNGINFPITKVTDKFGNFIDYKYLKDGNVFYVSEISYGANSDSQTHYASIKFEYVDRSDVVALYENGIKVEQKKLLSKITTYFNNNLQRSYVLKHEKKDVAFLRQIDLTISGKTLNPLVFYMVKQKGLILQLQRRNSLVFLNMRKAPAGSIISIMPSLI